MLIHLIVAVLSFCLGHMTAKNRKKYIFYTSRNLGSSEYNSVSKEMEARMAKNDFLLLGPNFSKVERF